MSRARRATVLAGVSFGLAVAASVWLAVWPCAYRGESASMPGATSTVVHTCSSMVDVNGTRILVILAVPVVLTAFALVAVAVGVRPAVFGIALVYVVLTVLALASIGLFYVPSVIALIAAAFTTSSRSVAVVPGSG